MKVVALTPTFSAEDFATAAYTDALNDVRFNTHYFQDSLLQVHQYRDNLEMMDLTNAMQAGKKCLRVTVAPVTAKAGYDLLATLRASYLFNYKLLFDNLCELGADSLGTFRPVEVELEGEMWRVNVYEEPSVRTYSPFAQVKPLKEEPKKWTAAHVVKALLNGQFEGLQCDGKYTDDYAFDAAYNFQIGEHVDQGRYLIEKLVKRPEGWWFANENGGRVSANCGQHAYHSFKLVLKPEKVAA